MNSVVQTTSNLIAVLDRKIELFKKILDITKKQKEDIAKNEAENMNALIGEKQQIIEKINEFNKVFDNQFEALKNALGVNTLENADVAKYPMLKELKEKVQTMTSIIEEIMTIEKENNSRVSEILGNIKSQIKQLNVGKRGIKGYGTSSPMNDGIYIDKKIE